MNVLVDTSVWSLALRRKGHASPSPLVAVLADLVHDRRALIMGHVRQELLSGVRTRDQFDALREHLRAFPDVELGTGEYEEAASFSNRCRAAGVPHTLASTQGRAFGPCANRDRYEGRPLHRHA